MTTPNAAASGRRISDRTLNRLIYGLIALLLVGIPAIALTYYLDRHVDDGPSIIDRAVTAAEEAVRADPNLLSSRLQLAYAYAASDRQADAVAQYDIVLGEEPEHRAALLGRADAHRALGEMDAAVADYQALVELAREGEMANVDKQLEAAYYGLGVIAFEQDRAADAAENLANALVIDRTDADALDMMGRSLVKLGDYDSAVEALRDAVTLVPTGWCDPYAHMGEAYTAKGDVDGAAYASGMVAMCEGRTADARQLLEPLAAGAHSRDVLIGLALLAEDIGDPTTAAAYYGQVYAMDPTDFAAVTGLARTGTPPSTPAANGAQ